jgi:hypothetical protein
MLIESKLATSAFYKSAMKGPATIRCGVNRLYATSPGKNKGSTFILELPLVKK